MEPILRTASVVISGRIGGSVVQSRSRIHERAISLRFLNIIFSSQNLGFRLQCLHYKTVSNNTFALGRGGVRPVRGGVCG